MNSEELAPVSDEEPVRENQEKGIPVNNFPEAAADVEIVTGPGPLIFSVSSDDYVVDLSADSDYDEDSDSDDSLVSTACSHDPLLKADVSDGSSSQRSNGIFLDLNEPCEEETDVKTSGLPDLNYRATDDDLESSCAETSPRLYHTLSGYNVRYEQQRDYTFPTWASARDWVSPVYPYMVTNEAKPGNHIFRRSDIHFLELKKDLVKSKSGYRELQLFGQSILVPDAPVLKTGMKRKDTDCSSQLCSRSTNNKWTRLTL